MSQKPVVSDLDVDSAIDTWKAELAQMEMEMASAGSEEHKTGKLDFHFFESFYSLLMVALYMLLVLIPIRCHF